MNTKKKQWHLLNDKEEGSLLERVLKARNLNQGFLDKKIWHDPFLFRDMGQVVSRIKEAIKRKERIMIFGDYDADGVTASTILFKFLKSLGAQVSVRLPHRQRDGYGLKKDFFDDWKKLNVKLVITVDCGISNIREISYAQSLGIEVIVTDHHTPHQELPSALILNPKLTEDSYPFSDLVGAGVALKLVQALITDLKFSRELSRKHFLSSVTYAAIGTVADCAPLVNENRSIVSCGLQSMRHMENKEIEALISVAGLDKKNIDTDSIGFALAPRINAAGRLGDPLLALSLFLGDKSKARELENLNCRRRKVSQELVARARENFSESESAFVFGAPDLHEGIIGLVAGNISEEFMVPSVVMTEREDYFVASCRSPANFNLIAILEKLSDLFVHFGGHREAAGFRMKKGNESLFRERFLALCQEKLEEEAPVVKINIDTTISLSEISTDNFDSLEDLAPFGIGNPRPNFLLRQVRVKNLKKIGSDRNHLSFLVQDGNVSREVIAFFWGECDHLFQGEVDLVGEIIADEFRGNRKAKLKLLDVRVPEIKQT